MPYITPDTLADSYDVIVVGSGAGGGQVAYTLTMEGVKVLMLEAGRFYDAVKEPAMFKAYGDAPLGGSSTDDKPWGFFDAMVGGFNIPGEPYINASTEKPKQFHWFRARMLGGRTNHWERVSLRNGPYDFKPYSRDGLGVDWPISYDDLAPYYDKVEMLIGVHGSNEGLENTPDSSPGVLQPPPKPRIGELLMRQRGARLGMPFVPARRAVLTRPLDHENIPRKLHPNNPKAQRILADDMKARAACFWATPCGRGCSIRANYQSTTVHLPPALASGNLDIVTGAMVYQVEHDDDGKATGVLFIDKKTGRQCRAKGRAVVLAASSCESVRILLQSKSHRFPEGLGNSNGMLGRYLIDSAAAGAFAQVPLLEDMPPMNEDGAGSGHLYVPWWLYQQQLAGKLDFPRGYSLTLTTGRLAGPADQWAGSEYFTGGSYGPGLKRHLRRLFSSFVALWACGETIPNEKSFCELDPDTKDKWGHPVLRFHWEWSDHEHRQVAHLGKTCAALFDEMGAKYDKQISFSPLTQAGESNHEVGGARMGSDPKKSVTNASCRVWDSKNVFVADGSPFCSSSNKNPTLTILALAWRTADQVRDGLARGDF